MAARPGFGPWRCMVAWSQKRPNNGTRPKIWARWRSLSFYSGNLLPSGVRSALVLALSVSVAVGAIGWLGRAWWHSEGRVMDRPLWAATLCFTLVVSPYAPIYDTILVVVAVALVASEAPAVWLLLLYMIPWVTQSFAEFLHLQLLTLCLAGFGIWALRLSERDSEIAGRTTVSHSKPRQEESTMPKQLQRRATGRFQVRSRGLP